MKGVKAMLVVLSFLPVLPMAQGQENRINLFESTIVESQERYGDQILAMMIQGDNLQRRGKFEEAVLAYDVAIAQDPYLADAYIKRATLKYRLGRVTEASRDYDQAIRLNPYAADLYGYQGHLRKLRVLAFNPSDYGHEEIVRKKLAGDIMGALQEVNEAIRQSDTPDAALFKLRGNINVLLGRYIQAEEDYSLALQLDPGMQEARFNRGIARILAYNRPDGCLDLRQTVEAGYEQGLERLQYLCNF